MKIGIADTNFARYDMARAAIKELRRGCNLGMPGPKPIDSLWRPGPASGRGSRTRGWWGAERFGRRSPSG